MKNSLPSAFDVIVQELVHTFVIMHYFSISRAGQAEDWERAAETPAVPPSQMWRSNSRKLGHKKGYEIQELRRANRKRAEPG